MSMFRSRRQEAISRRIKVAVAVAALLLALAVLGAWLTTRYYLSGAANRPESSAPSSTPTEEITAETATTLLILGDAGKEHFLLVQFAPADRQGYVAAVPATLDAGNGQTIAITVQKNGYPRVKQAIQNTLQLPLSHYIAADTKAVEEYMNYLEGGLTFTLPEEVTYTDENGLTTHLSAGQRQLTAGQVGLLLRYEGWSSTPVGHTVVAQLVEAILNQYMTPNHRFDGDFAALSNLVQTDIRIDHYNAYRTALQAMGDANNAGSLIQVVSIVGATESGLFKPDLTAMQQSPLYSQTEGGAG
ncbi:MAG: hypothetical protein IJ518_06980 [Clostridia bacterium]|nr:hypothetical protein [Clostridia bacterium]